MADMKRRSLILHSGKEIKLFGNSLAISKSLQIGEGGAPNILSCSQPEPDKSKPFQGSGGEGAIPDAKTKNKPIVLNPHYLTVEDLFDIADYNIRLWVEFKDSLRKNGLTTKLFNNDSTA